MVPSQRTFLRTLSASLPYSLKNAAWILSCSDYLVGKNRNMTDRYYFSLIIAQQEEYWPCSISLQQSLASTQVSNCQMLDIPEISPLLESREKEYFAMIPAAASASDPFDICSVISQRIPLPAICCSDS